MAFLPFTLADFRLVSASLFTNAAGGNLPTTQRNHDVSYPVSTGTGDQNANTQPVDATQCLVTIEQRSAVRRTAITHTTDILKRFRTLDQAGAAAAGSCSWAIWGCPPGLFQ